MIRLSINDWKVDIYLHAIQTHATDTFDEDWFYALDTLCTTDSFKLQTPYV